MIISKIALNRKYIDRDGYIKGTSDYVGKGGNVYCAEWETEILNKTYYYSEYFRGKNREEVKRAIIKYIIGYGFKDSDINFYI